MLGKMEEMEVEQDKKGWEEATVLNVPADEKTGQGGLASCREEIWDNALGWERKEEGEGRRDDSEEKRCNAMEEIEVKDWKGERNCGALIMLLSFIN